MSKYRTPPHPLGCNVVGLLLGLLSGCGAGVLMWTP